MNMVSIIYHPHEEVPFSRTKFGCYKPGTRNAVGSHNERNIFRTFRKPEDFSQRNNKHFISLVESDRVPVKPKPHSHARWTLIKIKRTGPRLGDVDFVNNLVVICNKHAISYWDTDSWGITSYANFSLVVERLEIGSGKTYVTFCQIGVG